VVASFLAAFFFALTGTCGSYNIRANGPVRGNLGRLVVAALALGLFAHTAGNGFASASVGWFFLSGIIGMGIGDLGVYGALPLLGSRLTVLMTQCLAAPIAAFGEWLWLGTKLTAVQMLWGLLILGGVAIAITPSRANPPRVQVRPIGYLFGLVAAAGPGLGALVSRKGVLVANAAGEITNNPIFGLNAAYHRILAATPTGIVLPIAATAPLLAIPIAFFLEGDRPPRRAILGGVFAVTGCIALTAAR
jgi:drug/metabolite transporter (DMT)-like permease